MAQLLGVVKPSVVVEKRIVARTAPRVVQPVVFHEVETISGGKKSVDKFE
jgi:hypothetical protein